MKDPLIEELQRKQDSARFTAHQTSTDAAWHEFHLVRNKLKSAIRTAQEAFIEKALYSNKSHEVWKVIQRGLKPSARPLQFEPDELNNFFTTTAQRTLETQVTPIEDLTCLIDNLPDVPSEGMRFQLSPVTSENVLKVIKNLLSDYSTGTDQIHTRFIKIRQDKTRQLYFTRVAQSAARLVSLGALGKDSCRVLDSPPNIHHQQMHCKSLFSKAMEDCSGVPSSKD